MAKDTGPDLPQRPDPAGGRDLQGVTVLVTGASSGIGAAAARGFGARGATVAVIGRSPERTAAVAGSVGGRAHIADFGRLDDVRRLAAELLAAHARIDVLANNAGGLFTRRTTSADGHEMTFQVNHLAPFLLTNLLLDRLIAAPRGGRVINTSSDVHRMGRLDLEDLDCRRGRRSLLRAYPASKLATILFTRELSRRTADTALIAAAFHPGLVATELGRGSAVFGPLMRTRLARALLTSPERGAEPLLYLATEPDTQALNGAYFNRLTREEPKNEQAHDADLARRLWERSAELTGL
ncbi:MAG TPA: SDR family NAD(P)-dependent oxidoreductase [Actinospica sp.]|nr:SDR family NAD(P)-dependent oxidoreductase [Actinospica sp.]